MNMFQRRTLDDLFQSFAYDMGHTNGNLKKTAYMLYVTELQGRLTDAVDAMAKASTKEDGARIFAEFVGGGC